MTEQIDRPKREAASKAVSDLTLKLNRKYEGRAVSRYHPPPKSRDGCTGESSCADQEDDTLKYGLVYTNLTLSLFHYLLYRNSPRERPWPVKLFVKWLDFLPMSDVFWI